MPPIDSLHDVSRWYDRAMNIIEYRFLQSAFLSKNQLFLKIWCTTRKLACSDQETARSLIQIGKIFYESSTRQQSQETTCYGCRRFSLATEREITSTRQFPMVIENRYNIRGWSLSKAIDILEGNDASQKIVVCLGKEITRVFRVQNKKQELILKYKKEGESLEEKRLIL